MILSEKIKFFRKQNKMSQMEVAEALDVSRQVISKWEVGSYVPSSKNLIQLSELFQIPLEVLIKENAEIPEAQSSNTSAEDVIPYQVQKPTQGEDRVDRPEKKRTVLTVCALVACVLIVIIALCVGFYRMEKKIDRLMPEDTAAPMEEMDRKEVDRSSIGQVDFNQAEP